MVSGSPGGGSKPDTRASSEIPSGDDLLERDAELLTLRTLLANVLDGSGTLLIVEGPPGIGKTALLARLTDEASESGMLVLTSRGSDLEQEFAFGITRQLFEPAITALTQAERGEALAGDARLAAGLVGAERFGEVTSRRPAELFPLLHGLYWLSANLTGTRPLVLVVDDVHWADAPSLKFLQYLARRVGELPILIALGARSTYPEAPVPALEAIRPEPLVKTLRPRNLSELAAAELLENAFGSRPDPEFARACHEASDGNPFLLNELGRSLAADRVAPDAASAGDVRNVHSEAISRQVLVRLSRLSEAARSLAQATAVLGPDAEVRNVAALAEMSEEEAVAPLDSLVDARVLAPGRPLRFRHALLQTTVYTDMADGRRGQDHKRAARLLADDGALAERVAGHLLQAEPLGDQWVVDSLRAAAQSAFDQGAPEQAASYLRRALKEPPADQARVMLELGAATARAGQHDARELLRQALEQAPSDQLRVQAVVELGMDLANAGRLEEASVVVRRVLATLDEAQKPLVRALEMMILVLAECSVFARRLAGDAIARAEATVAKHGESSPRGVLAIAAFERATVNGTADEAARLGDLAFAGGTLFVEQPVDSAHAYFASAALAMAGRLGVADRCLGDAIAANRARGSLRGVAFASAMRAMVRHERGDLDAAEQDAEAFFALEADAEWNIFALAAASALAEVKIDRGALEEAQTALERVDRTVDHVLFQPVRMARARVSLARRDPHAALDELGRCAEWEESWGVRNPVWCEWRSLAARAHLMREEPELAAELAAEQLERVRPFGSDAATGRALRAAGVVTGGDEGIELLLEAVERLERSQAQLEHAGALLDLGAAMRRAKRRADCREPLRQAADAAQRLGATQLAERAGEELRASGARPRRLELSGVDSLTARERQVAQVAATGLSNREIAQQLFVSKKTVETHLGSIYRKLDVSSREEVAEALAAAE
jgi:DNA-binding CsgD family transcriptional regulator/tetratricopeptide (TPR) repeat protein